MTHADRKLTDAGDLEEIRHDFKLHLVAAPETSGCEGCVACSDDGGGHINAGLCQALPECVGIVWMRVA